MSDEVRELFHREASAIPSARPDPGAVVAGARRRLRWRRALAVSAAIVVAAAVVARGGGVLERDPHPPASESARLTVLVRIPLMSSWTAGRSLVRDVAHGFGHVWVLREGERTLQRIDPATNRVEETLSLGPDAAYWALDAGFGRLWVVGPNKDTVLAVDPSSGKVTARLEGVDAPHDVMATGEHLWVHSAGQGGAIVRVDPRTLETVGSIRLGDACCVSGMVEHGGYLWVSHSDVADARRDPTADHDDAEFDLANALLKIDPREMRVVDAIPLPGETYRPGDTVLGDLEAAAGYLWVAHPDGRHVDRVDPRSGAVDVVDLEEVMRPNALSWFDGKVWAWELNGSLVAPIDPLSLAVGDVMDLNHTVSGWPVEAAGSLWTGAGASGERPYLLRVGLPEDVPVHTPPPPPEPTPPPRGDVVEQLSEQEQAEIFAFRALAETGLMHPFSPRTYLFGDSEETTRAADAWRIGFAASDCEPRETEEGLAFTCTGLSGEDPRLGNALTDTYVTVERDAGRWRVTRVDGNMPPEHRRRVVGYEREQRAEPSHWEFPAAGAWPTESGLVAAMIALWVGPYPTDAPGSVCEVVALDSAGNRVGKVYRFYAEPPNRPFEHAGWLRSVELGPPDSGAERIEVDCYQRGAQR